MAELESLVIKITADTTEFVKAMDEATKAVVRLGDALFAIRPWWARLWLSVRHPIQAHARWKRVHHKGG
jgi:hypothetical protein